MKPINNDAKSLIRSYIDDIEKYMKSTGEIHPNEIDALLNEINDFMFIRSNEIATGDSILYSDVLKAIDECGSPSEISEQYLDSEEPDDTITEEISDSTKHPKLFFTRKTSERRITEHSAIYDKDRSRGSWFRNYLKAPFFTLIRFPPIIFILFVLFLMIISPLFPYYDTDYYSIELIEIFDEYFAITIFTCLWFTFSEGLFFDKWKNRLDPTKFKRKIDDNLIITLARIGFISVCFKTSVLPMPEYLIVIVPIPFLCLIFLERRFKTHFWVSRVSPSLLKAANDMEEGSFSVTLNIPRKFLQMYQDIDIIKKIYLVALSFIFIISLFLPGKYGWKEWRFPFDISEEYFNVFYPGSTLNFIITLSIFGMIFLFIGILIDIKQKERVNEFGSFDNSTATWLIRIFTLRMIFLILTYNSRGTLGRLLLFLLPLYLFFEIFKGRSVNSPVITAIRYVGQSNEKGKYPSSKKRQKIVSTSKPSKNQESPTELPPTPSFFTRIRRRIIPLFKNFISGLVLIAKKIVERIYDPLRSSLKALFVTIFLLIGSIVEIFLVLFSMLTAVSTDGSIHLPTYAFNIGSYHYRFSEIIIWSWYIIGILAIQLFLLVLVEWFLYLNQSSEGFLTLFFRNLSRIILSILYIGIFIQISSGDQYAYVRLYLLIILTLFSEITAFKIRLERRKWSLNNSLQTRNVG